MFFKSPKTIFDYKPNFCGNLGYSLNFELLFIEPTIVLLMKKSTIISLEPLYKCVLNQQFVEKSHKSPHHNPYTQKHRTVVSSELAVKNFTRTGK